MPKTTRIIVLILSLSVFCPFACGTFFDPILLTDSSYKPVFYNEIIRKIKSLPKRSIPLGIRDLELTREDL